MSFAFGVVVSTSGASSRFPTIRRLARSRRTLIGAVILAVMILTCAAGPHLLPYDDLFIDLRARFAPPLTGAHLLGTDQLGRDVLARLLMAGRISLTVGIAAMALSVAVGVGVGLVAGFYGGLVGTLLMRLVDAMLCFPTIFFLLTLSSLVRAGIDSIVLLIAATAWMEVARLMNGEVRSLRDREFTQAAEAIGASDLRIMLRELLPNALASIVVAATLNVARAILAESYISFLGYGVQPPTASWGNMLSAAQTYLKDAPWLAIVPGLAIALTVTSINFLGEGLRDAVDPRASNP